MAELNTTQNTDPANTNANAAVPWANAQLIDPNPPMSEAEKVARDSLNTPYDPSQPLAQSGFGGMAVIYQTLQLLIQITDKLSAASISRANYINNVLIPAQNKEGNLVNSSDYFMKGQGSKNIKGGQQDRADQQAKNRDDANRSISAASQKHQMNRGVVSDQIKIEQTKLQTNDDTISQIKSLFNKNITDLGDILRSIFP